MPAAERLDPYLGLTGGLRLLFDPTIDGIRDPWRQVKKPDPIPGFQFGFWVIFSNPNHFANAAYLNLRFGYMKRNDEPLPRLARVDGLNEEAALADILGVSEQMLLFPLLGHLENDNGIPEIPAFIRKLLRFFLTFLVFLFFLLFVRCHILPTDGLDSIIPPGRR